MTIFEIPTQPFPQSFTITLAGVVYNFTIVWNDAAQAWTMDIADANDVPILTGIPMVTGADLLEQYDYLGFGVVLGSQTDFDTDAPPTYANLGTTGHLYFSVPS